MGHKRQRRRSRCGAGRSGRGDEGRRVMEVHPYTLEARKRCEMPYPESEFWADGYQEARQRAVDARLRVIDISLN